MTKKSLSDLLKEEANKAEAPDPAEASAAEAEEKEAPKAAPKATSKAAPKTTASRRSRTGAGRRTATSRKTVKPEEKPEDTAIAPANAVAGIPTPAVSKTEATAPDPDLAQRLSALEKDLAAAQEEKAQLEKTIAADTDLAQQLSALEKDLAAAQKEKAQLEKTIAGLQKDLATQQERLFELKDSLAQAESGTKAKAEALTKTQAELDEAKQTILKLAEAEAPAPAPAPRRISGVDITPRRPVEVQPNRPTYHRGVPDYAIQKGQPNPMLTDADIGWVD